MNKKADGGLSDIYLKHLPQFHWQSTWSLGGGAPDINGCLDGQELWIENKSTSGWAVKFEFGQVAWHERRLRAGGRTFVAVRRLASAGPRRGDELWLFRGDQARQLEEKGLKETRPIFWEQGGPARWHWDEVGRIFKAKPPVPPLAYHPCDH